MHKNKNGKPKRKFLLKIARLHTIVSSLLFFFYLALSVLYSPAFLIKDLQNKVRAAEHTITITAVVLGPPVAPIVTLNQSCESEMLSVRLSWPQDTNAKSFDVYRNGEVLITGVTASYYVDTRVSTGQTYTYSVVALGTMGPGYAQSEPASIDTMPVCGPSDPNAITVSITTFDNKNRSQYTETPSTTTPNPSFSGTTNTPNANIVIQIANVVSAQTTANSNGYWNWQVPTNMAPGTYTLTATAKNPTDPNKTAQTSLTFIILDTPTPTPTPSPTTVSTSTTTTTTTSNKKRQTTTTTKTSLPTTGNATLQFTPKMDDEIVFQGGDVKISLTIEELSKELEGEQGTFFYRLLDEKGVEILSVNEEIGGLKPFLMNKQTILIPPYVKAGQYTLRFGIISEGHTFSKDYRITVKAKPFIKLGADIQMTYPEFISKIGTMSIFMLIFLLLWPFAFLWEARLYSHARNNISEYNLIRFGYLGEIPPRKKRKERRLLP